MVCVCAAGNKMRLAAEYLVLNLSPLRFSQPLLVWSLADPRVVSLFLSSSSLRRGWDSAPALCATRTDSETPLMVLGTPTADHSLTRLVPVEISCIHSSFIKIYCTYYFYTILQHGGSPARRPSRGKSALTISPLPRIPGPFLTSEGRSPSPCGRVPLPIHLSHIP